MITGPGGGVGAAELRPSAAQQQLMSVIDFAGCGTVTVRRTSDSSTTTHSFLHHATKTQQLNLETVGWPHQQRAHCEGHSLGGGSVRAVRGGWEEVTGGDETE